MPNKRTKTKKKKKTSDLWITPRYSLKGPAGERAWENRPGGAPSTSRYLELADIALLCGFTDQSHFTRVFSRSEGYSPGRWRRLHRL